MNTQLSSLSPCTFRSHTGMVLLLCLIFLMALTLLGLSASSDTILQSKLANNLQETERAKQSALSALSWAEQWLLEFDGLSPETCSARCDGLYLHATGNLPNSPEFESHSWWLSQGYEAGLDPLTGERIATISSDSINPPVWVVEVAHTIPPAENGTSDSQVWYRILARGNGRSETAVSVIESTIVRSWPSGEETGLPINVAPSPCPGSVQSALCGRFSWRELR